MSIGDVFLALFCLAMIANVVALVRHYRALRTFRIVLGNLAETQRKFNEIMETEQRKKP